MTDKHTKPTPGPWGVGMRNGRNPDKIFARDGENEHEDPCIASLPGITLNRYLDEIEDCEPLRNAYLIAAAPDLLEALELIQFGFKHTRCPMCAGWDMSPNGETDYKHTKECPVRRAIAKAKGEV